MLIGSRLRLDMGMFIVASVIAFLLLHGFVISSLPEVDFFEEGISAVRLGPVSLWQMEVSSWPDGAPGFYTTQKWHHPTILFTAMTAGLVLTLAWRLSLQAIQLTRGTR